MTKRHLKRQLNLLQVIMLGTAGTIAAEIFVLTGHAAGIAGPAAVLALLVGGLLTLSVALNYCELATTYPVTGGAMTYVREAFGNNLLMFLVGSLDCLSSTFYAALSSIGFAYSLKVFIPGLPVVPVAMLVILLFTVLHIRGVYEAGNIQIFLGGFLLLVFTAFIVLGLTRSTGFHMDIFTSGQAVFEHHTLWANIARMMATIALVYNAYVGFEVIADDAEEVTNPSRNIPMGILVSLGISTLVYSLVALVTIGTVPYSELAGSETALTDAAMRFWPRLGVPLMAVAGIVATLTSVNSAMLSATREAFSLSRFGVWPRPFSRLGRYRTPYVSIIIIGAISALVAAIGLVDFLSFISSAGYLFVLFWASLAMVNLRKAHPTIERPFKAPFFPLTAYAAAGAGFFIVAFTRVEALLFLGGVLAVCSVFYYGGRVFANRRKARQELAEANGANRILIPVSNPDTAESLARLAAVMGQMQEDTSICLFTVVQTSGVLSPEAAERALNRINNKHVLLERVAHFAQERNVALYTKRRAATNLAESILKELNGHGDVRMVLMGWPGAITGQDLAHNVVKEVLITARAHVAVLRDRGLQRVQRILVPVGGGPHARLCLRWASQIAEIEKGSVTAFRVLPKTMELEESEDQMLLLQEIVEEELGGAVPKAMKFRVTYADNIVDGILAETQRQPYDLLMIGSSEQWFSRNYLFGYINDQIVENAPCSTLIVRRYQSETMAWLRRQVKKIEE
ncbi:amino acid permease [Ornatilinea apprima]|nr:amino acid permease [Ornatilinea apprima]